MHREICSSGHFSVHLLGRRNAPAADAARLSFFERNIEIAGSLFKTTRLGEETMGTEYELKLATSKTGLRKALALRALGIVVIAPSAINEPQRAIEKHAAEAIAFDRCLRPCKVRATFPLERACKHLELAPLGMVLKIWIDRFADEHITVARWAELLS